jgi:hypothetical protein
VITGHDDGVVDGQPGAGDVWHGGRMSSLVHQGGSVKREAEVVCGAASGSEVPAIEEG